MHLHIVPNRNSKPAILLRESYREDGKVKKRTVANLSFLSLQQAEMINLVLKGQKLAPVDQLFEKIESKHHGHVHAVLKAIDRLGLEKVISSKPCRQRDIIVATIAAVVTEPDSKLGITRWWSDTTLPQSLGLSDVDEDDIYEAMDWLVARQPSIEKKLARRHLKEGDVVTYDLTSSYFEGTKCPLAKLGHSRDGKKGKLQVNWGLVADGRGCPVSVSVYEGNVGDPKTLVPEVRKVREELGIKQMVLVGDRGMISQKQIDTVRDVEGIEWITALKSGGIRKLVEGGALQLGLFDERNLFEFCSDEYPGERLVACRNPELAKLRRSTRESMIESTKKELHKVRGMAGRGKMKGRDKIGVRVGKVVNKYKMAKHFELEIRDDGFDFELSEQSVAAEAALDGVYVIRTSVSVQRMDAAEAVRCYKKLSDIERAFRTLKSIDLMVRPIRHRTEDRVRAHIFLCMLAYYVQWHMMEAWRELLFADEDQESKKSRDPVAPAKRSGGALVKVHTKELDDGSAAHSFRTLLHHMSTITRDLCRSRIEGTSAATFTMDTMANPKQRHALELLSRISV
jgi:transposase